MKNFKFLILVLGLTLAQGVLAVTLPSTSYTPYSQADEYASVGVPNGVSMPKTNFTSLGADGDESAFEACVSENPGPENIMACQNCVIDQYKACETKCSGNMDCIMECAQLSGKYAGECGRSLPLDGGLGILLVLSVLGGAVKLLLRHKA